MRDDDVTVTGKNCKVITCKAPATITLQPNKGEKHTGVFSFMLGFDSNKVKVSSVKSNFKYYEFDTDAYEFNYSKKYTPDTKPDSYGIADGSAMTLTKAGTYVAYVRPMSGVDDTDVPLTPVFIVVK